MAERNLNIVIRAADEYSKALNHFETSIGRAADKVDVSGNRMQTRFDSVGGSIMGIQAAWIKMAGVVAASAWLIDGAKQALEGEKSMNQLRIQINSLGLDYSALKGQIEGALEASSKYAAVQDDEVAAVFKQLIFMTGDYTQSIQNLNLVFDLAYQKNISHSEAATLVGKAMAGNIEALGRIIPEFKNLDDSLGKNATASEKAALAMDLLRSKVSGAVSEMTEHERKVAEVTLAYHNLKESIGNVALEIADLTLKNLRAPLEWYATLAHSIDTLASKMNGNIVVTEAAGAVFQEQTHPLSKFNEQLGKGRESAEQMAAAVEKLKERIDSLVPKDLGASAFTSMFAPVSLSAGTSNPLMDAFLAPSDEEKPEVSLPESDAEAWEAAMERIIAAKEKMTESLTGNDALIEFSTQARTRIVNASYQAMEDQMLSLVETGKFSLGALAQVVAGQVKIELVGLAARAAVWAIYETAMGLKDLAAGSPTAAVHFAAAGEFAMVAGAALAGAAAVHGLFGGKAERPAVGSPTGEPIRTSPITGELMPESLQAGSPVSITLIVNTLDGADVNWDRIIEKNLTPALERYSGDGNRPMNIRVEQR